MVTIGSIFWLTFGEHDAIRKADEVDAVFVKIKPHAQTTINFVQFLEGLRHCAMLTRLSLNETVQRIVAIGGPVEMVHK